MQVSKLANLPAILSSVNDAIDRSTQLSLSTIADVAVQIIVLFLKLDLVGTQTVVALIEEEIPFNESIQQLSKKVRVESEIENSISKYQALLCAYNSAMYQSPFILETIDEEEVSRRPSSLLTLVARLTAEPYEVLKSLDDTSINQLHAFVSQPTNSSVQSKD